MRLDCWERGELELCRLVAISIGEAGPGMTRAGGWGDADGKSGSVVSSSSDGNSKSSILKMSWRLV